MRDAFKVQPSVSSIGFMVGAAIGTMLYPLLGKLATRVGPGLVLALGLSTSMGCFGGMALLPRIDVNWEGAASMVALVLAAVAYAPEVVAATMLVARLTPFSEGSAMGMLNSAIAAGAIIGALVPAAIAARYGYPALPLMAALVLVAALVVALPLIRATRTAEDSVKDGGSGP
jgi:MFS family permease